jgi:phosphoribosylformylglycinamidine synthase subunit PurS
LTAIKTGSSANGTAATGHRTFLAEVFVEPKPGVNDPQGEAILGGLRSLGYEGVDRVRSGRYFQVALAAPDRAAAEAEVRSMCDRLLANPVIERYRVSVNEVTPSTD